MAVESFDKGVFAFVEGRERPIDLIDYSVSEDATPLIPGDTSGGIGQISFSARAITKGPIKGRTAALIDRQVQLLDRAGIDDTKFLGRGSIFGKITSCSQPGELANFQADTLLTRLNAERDAKPFFGVQELGTYTSVRNNLVTNPSGETNTTGYTGVPGTGGAMSAIARQALDPWVGTYRIQGVWTTAATGTGGIEYLCTGLTGDTTYTASWYARVWYSAASNTGSVQRLRMDVKWYTSASVLISTDIGVEMEIDKSKWERMSVTATAPSNADRMVIYIHNQAGTGFVNWPSGGELTLDAGMVEQSSVVGTYLDGTTLNAAWDGTAHASTSTETIVGVPLAVVDATVGNAFRYYCGLVGIPSTAITVDEIFDRRPVAYPAWSGNVYVKIKELCAAVGAEVVMQENIIRLRSPRRHVTPVDRADLFTQNVNTQNIARFVEILNYNNQWSGDRVAHSSQTIYSVESGEMIEVTVEVDASMVSYNDPIPVTSIEPTDYRTGSGQYVIIDANDASVDPDWWTSNGGLITASTIPDRYNSLVIGIRGARSEASTYKAPFRIAEYVGEDAIAALHITGEGVFSDKKIVRIPTGAAESSTSSDTASTIDNIFISDISQAYDRGALAAGRAAGPSVTIQGHISYDSAAAGQEFGVVVGARIKVYDGIYRVTSANYTRSGIEVTAYLDMTFDDFVDLFSLTLDEFNATYAGLSFDSFNALWPVDTTFDNFNGQVAAPTFDTFNGLFDGLTFDEYAVFPYIKDVIQVDPEAGL